MTRDILHLMEYKMKYKSGIKDIYLHSTMNVTTGGD